MVAENRLLRRLRETIDRAGPISIAEYMRLCLTDPEDGYYTTSGGIGREGDFITAPEISQIFGELIGLFFADYWQRSGRPSFVRLVELGPGRGTLMADILRAGETVPGFSEAVSIDLVELSPKLRMLQGKALAPSGHEAVWRDDLQDVPDDAPIYLIANEFFDALPIRQFVRSANNWHERLVGWDCDDGSLAYSTSEAISPFETDFADVDVGDIAEHCPLAREIASGISRRIAHRGGVAVVIDYGYEGPAVGDTLQAVRRHAYADPLSEPGQVDLTGHVDFAPLKSAAIQEAAVAWGPIPQGAFLRRLGLEERLAVLANEKSDAVVSSLRIAAERLVGVRQMGRLFKALAITSPTGPAPAAFQVSDANQAGVI